MDRTKPKSSAAAPASLSDLPDEALLEILSRLPVKPLHRSKCVAKAWRDLIDDPIHRKKLFPQTLEGFFFMYEGFYAGAGSDDEGSDEGGGSFDGGHLGFVNLGERLLPVDIDHQFSFLTEMPGIETLLLKDSCNGLLLFEHVRELNPVDQIGYIVCNPATKRWGMVPNCDCPSDTEPYTFLFFDPAASAYFHLVKFCYHVVVDNVDLLEEGEEQVSVTTVVHTYSSETGTWSHSSRDWMVEEEQGQLEGWRHQGLQPFSFGSSSVFLNGMLHLLLVDGGQVVVVDMQGKTRRIIHLPIAEEDRRDYFGYVAKSQGCLHYIHQKYGAQGNQLFIWVLSDCDTQEWILKGTVNFSELFGEEIVGDGISIHPDQNVVFFKALNRKLMSYHLDHKEVSVITTFEKEYHSNIFPYVPYFSESPALTNMH
ncbi:hypothetical protein ACP70R_014743 [Stipagrostis hirtigluma subsp. patula]